MDIRTKLSDIIEDIETKSKKVDLPITKLCEKAQIARSTFDRWKRNDNEPSLIAIQRIYAVLESASKQSK